MNVETKGLSFGKCWAGPPISKDALHYNNSLKVKRRGRKMNSHYGAVSSNIFPPGRRARGRTRGSAQE